MCDCRAAQVRTSTVRFPPTFTCPRTEVVLGLLQVCSSHSAPSMSRGFHSTSNYASGNSARGYTTASSSIYGSTMIRAALTSATTLKMANGLSLVGRRCSYRQPFHRESFKHNIKHRETWASHLSENRRDKMLTTCPQKSTYTVNRT